MHILEIGYMAVPMVLLKQLMMPHMENTLNILMEHVTNMCNWKGVLKL